MDGDGGDRGECGDPGGSSPVDEGDAMKTFRDPDVRVLADDQETLLMGDLNHIVMHWSVVALCGKQVTGEMQDDPTGPVCSKCVGLMMRLRK